MNKQRMKKGFTIVELVIVIAVIGILATVLVPTFGDIITKANQAKDIQTTKNMNTALAVYGATMSEEPAGNGLIQTIDDVMKALKQAGFDTAKELTPVCKGHSFYWYKTTGQIVYVNEQKNDFALVYPKEITGFPDAKNEALLINIADEAPDASDEPDEPDTPDQPSESSFMHISFDDVQLCFKNLKNKTYSSLYNEPFFGWLKGLHDEYGTKFSLYAYYTDLAGVPSTYAADFAAASDWLKIGLHANNSSNSTGFSTYEEGKNAWNTFVGYVKVITGTTDSIDRMPRLHYFAGSEAALQGMRDAECGALGFLTADAERASYYFTQDLSAWIYNNDHITDHINNLVFLATDFRGDWFLNNTSNTYVYKKISKPTVYEELEYRFASEEFENTLTSFIFFAHEWQFYNGSALTSNKVWTEDACRFTFDKGISFDYPQNRTFSATEHDIYPGEDNDPPADEPQTTTRESDTLTCGLYNDV